MRFSFLLLGSKIPHTKTWTEEDITAAIVAVKRDKLSFRKAAAQFNVPKSTLADRLSGCTSNGPHRPKSFLSPEDESKLAVHLDNITNQGCGRSKEIILYMAAQIVIKQGNLAKGGCLSDKWWKGFLRRNPQISQAASKPSSMAQTSATRATTEIFYARLLGSMRADHLQGKPHLIFNACETTFKFDSINKLLAVAKDLKRVPQIPKDQQQWVTVLSCAAATGKTIAPLFIFRTPSGRVPPSVLDKAPSDTQFAALKSHWIDKDIYLAWFQEIFLKSIPDERPVLILVDGRKAIITQDFIRAAAVNKINIFILPAHTSRMLQPLDVSLDGLLKKRWISACAEFQDSAVVNQRNFAKLFNSVWNSSNTPDIVKDGFYRSGIFPFNPEAFDYSKLETMNPPGKVRSVAATTTASSKELPDANAAVITTPLPVQACSDAWLQPTESLPLSSISEAAGAVSSVSSPLSSTNHDLASPVVDSFDALISLEHSIGKVERDKYRRMYEDDHSLLAGGNYIKWKKLVTALGGLRKVSGCPCKTACSCSCSGFGFCDCLGCGVLPVKSMQTATIKPSPLSGDTPGPSCIISTSSGDVQTAHDVHSVVAELVRDDSGTQKRRQNDPERVQSKKKRNEREPQRRKSN